MANIIDPRAIKFSNNGARPSADKMAQAYYLAIPANDRWVTLGSGQAALDQMQPDLKAVADRILAAYTLAYWTEKNWFTNISPNALFPNDASPVFDNPTNTAADLTRPAITGAMVTNVVTRSVEFQNWMLSVAGAFNGTLQVETATAVGTIGTAGNATVVVTAYGMTNSPKTISVAVASADTAAIWAGKVRTALAADVDVSAFFTVGGSSTTISLTAKSAIANDNGMNLSLANGTCTGITAAPTSANTTAGVAARGGVSWLNTVIQCSTLYGPSPIVLVDAQNLVTRINELKTNYTANSSANLNTLLAVAVNPRQGTGT